MAAARRWQGLSRVGPTGCLGRSNLHADFQVLAAPKNAPLFEARLTPPATGE